MEDGGRQARTTAEAAEDRRRRTSTDGRRVAAPERGQRRRRRFLSAEDGVASVLPSPCATSRCPHLAPPWGRAARTLDTGEPCPVGGKGRGRVGLPPLVGFQMPQRLDRLFFIFIILLMFFYRFNTQKKFTKLAPAPRGLAPPPPQDIRTHLQLCYQSSVYNLVWLNTQINCVIFHAAWIKFQRLKPY